MTETVRVRRSFHPVPRTRGMITGVGLVLLGAWGALIPFVGPYFDYAYRPDTTWTWTAGRGYLEVLPGAVAFVAGVALLLTASRATAVAASWLGIAAGAWFVVGSLLSPLWHANYLGAPVGGTRDIAVEQVGMFYGLGAAIVLCAAVALGRFTVPELVSAPLTTPEPVPADYAPATDYAPAAGYAPAMDYASDQTAALPAVTSGPDEQTAEGDAHSHRRGAWRRGHFQPS